jgi:hypothetical protein
MKQLRDLLESRLETKANQKKGKREEEASREGVDLDTL